MTSHVCSMYGTCENRRGQCLEESKAVLFKVWRMLESSVIISREGTGCDVERIGERGTVCN